MEKRKLHNIILRFLKDNKIFHRIDFKDGYLKSIFKYVPEKIIFESNINYNKNHLNEFWIIKELELNELLLNKINNNLIDLNPFNSFSLKELIKKHLYFNLKNYIVFLNEPYPKKQYYNKKINDLLKL